MQKLVLEPAARSRLGTFDKPVELCDDAGKTIGRFVPEQCFRSSAYSWARESISNEELDRRAAEPGCSTLVQVLQRLENS